jgi:hypothetical protein
MNRRSGVCLVLIVLLVRFTKLRTQKPPENTAESLPHPQNGDRHKSLDIPKKQSS